MEKQNVTLSLPKDILQRAKILAIKRNHSLSSMLTDVLTEIVDAEDRYEEAWRRSLARLEAAQALSGDYTWNRESLHER
ncbi:MAG: DUF6364 family protein [Anaerolineae bacterium]|nr:DUF6364 family protein [Anaerolineae bacterium]